jgi:hypothetical protein
MRKTFWIFAVVFILTIGVSSAQAATTFTPSFTCLGGCMSTPTAPDVSFPSPVIFETWGNVSDPFGIGLLPGDLPSDTYTWSNTIMFPGVEGPQVADWTLSITDVTTGDSYGAVGMVGIGDPLFMGFSDSGTLTFSPSGGTTPAVPEPSTWAMLLLGFAGLGFAAYLRKSKPALMAA